MGEIADQVEKVFDIKDKKIKELQFALLDVLSGNHKWYEISYITACTIYRCEQLEELYNKTYEEVGEEWKNTE